MDVPVRRYHHRLTTENGPHNDYDGNRAMVYDKGRVIKVFCIATTILGALLSIGFIGLGCYIIITNPETKVTVFKVSLMDMETIPLAISAIVSLCVGGMGLTHSVSLRWALLNEGRLDYNTSTRLFATGSSWTNRWYGSLILKITAVLTYGSLAVFTVLYADTSHGNTPRVALGGMAAVVTGLSLGVQTVFATWSLAYNGNSIPTWSSNPVNTTLAAIENGNITPVSIHQQYQRLCQAAQKQGTMAQERPGIRYVLIAAWSHSVIATICSVAVGISFSPAYNKASNCWRLHFDWDLDLQACSRNVVFLARVYSQSTKSLSSDVILFIVIGAFFQSVQDIPLHYFDLIVKVSSDERAWKQSCGMTRANRAKRLAGAMFNPIGLISFAIKLALEWAVTHGLVLAFVEGELQTDGKPSIAFFLTVHYPRLIVYTGLSIICSLFVTYLAMRPSKGHQRATFGHLQTIADVISDWETDGNGVSRRRDTVEGLVFEFDQGGDTEGENGLGTRLVEASSSNELVEARSSNELVPPTNASEGDGEFAYLFDPELGFIAFKAAEIGETK